MLDYQNPLPSAEPNKASGAVLLLIPGGLGLNIAGVFENEHDASKHKYAKVEGVQFLTIPGASIQTVGGE